MALTKVKAGNILLTTPAASSNDVTPATTQYVTTAISNLVAGAPATLNTLDEIAAALNDDAALNTTLTNAIAAKLPLAGGTLTGSLAITTASTADTVTLTRGDVNQNNMFKFKTGSSDKWILGQRNDSTDHFRLYSYGTSSDVVSVYTDGKVGIGETAPSHLLHVKKPSSGDATLMLETVTGGDPTIYFNSAAANRSAIIRFLDQGSFAGGRIQYVHNGDRLEFQAGSGSGASLIVANNKVGIGVTGTPGNRLTVTENLSSALVANIGNTHASGFGVNIYGGSGSNYALRAEDYSGNERFIVRGDGNIGIGGGGGENSIRLFVETPSQNHIGLQVQNTNTADSFGMIVKAGNDANDYIADFRKRDNTNIMRIRGDGNIGIGTANPNAYAGQTAVTINSTGVARLDLDISQTMQGYLLAENGYVALYAAAGNYVAMGVSGTSKSIKIHSTGNVGIGTSATSTHPLHISVAASNDTIDETKGLVKLQSSGGNGTIMGTLASSPYTSYIQSGYVVDTSVAQYPISLNPLGGNVGIGKTNPGQALDVVGTIQSNIGLRVAGHPVVGYSSIAGGYAANLGSTGSSTLNETHIYSGGAQRVTIDNAKVKLNPTVLRGPNFWIGSVPNTANNNTGAVLLVNLTTINNNNIGFQFSGSIIGNSYTGQAFVNVNIVKHYSVDSVAFKANATDEMLNSVVGRMQLNLCTVTYSGSSYLAIVKNGGGTGTIFLNGYFQGWYPDQVTEVAAGTYTITTNHGNLNF